MKNLTIYEMGVLCLLRNNCFGEGEFKKVIPEECYLQVRNEVTRLFFYACLEKLRDVGFYNPADGKHDIEYKIGYVRIEK